MYPWATKEYLLWEMSLCQIVLYHNIGIDIKYPKPHGAKPSLKDKPIPEVKAIIADARRQNAIAKEAQVRILSEQRKAPYKEIYGDV